MKIACIGWGSLVWSPGVLRCSGPWNSDGPELPLEFARTSRDGRLTLVLTQGAGLVTTLWVELDYLTAEQAQAALAGREGCASPAIGLWPGTVPRHGVGATNIGKWAVGRDFDAVVWTALQPKFDGVNGQAPATAEAAVNYLRQLDTDTSLRAREYVERAPIQVQTPFRTAIEAGLGWRRAHMPEA